jgi:hypothetical protein
VGSRGGDDWIADPDDDLRPADHPTVSSRGKTSRRALPAMLPACGTQSAAWERQMPACTRCVW